MRPDDLTSRDEGEIWPSQRPRRSGGAPVRCLRQRDGKLGVAGGRSVPLASRSVQHCVAGMHERSGPAPARSISNGLAVVGPACPEGADPMRSRGLMPGLLHGTTNRKERRTGESGAQTAALRSIEADTIAASTRGERDHVRAVERHGVTVQFGIPQLFAAQLHKQGHRSRDLGSLRLGVAAGAPVSDELLRDAQRLLCPTLLVAYSLTEASSMVSVTRPDDPGEKRSHTVGRPLGGTAVRVLESDRTKLPLESVGEVAVRGPGVMKGYYRQPGETAGSFDAQGFLLTGDLGIVDEEGYVHLVGRRKEVIIRSGFNVSPRELEDRLRAHPAVRQSAVVGVPDPALGWARRSVPASFPWRGRSSPAVRSWNGAGGCRPTTRSPTLSALGTISP